MILTFNSHQYVERLTIIKKTTTTKFPTTELVLLGKKHANIERKILGQDQFYLSVEQKH